MITLYGSAQNRGSRCILALEECGLEYEVKPLDLQAGESKTPEYLRLNPNGRVPCLDDDGFVVWESMAINLYLAEKYGNGLLPEDPRGRALVAQWSFWAMTQLEQSLVTLFQHRVLLPEEERKPELADDAEKEAKKLLDILDHALEGRSYLLGEDLTIADINVSNVVSWARMLGVSNEGKPNVERWLEGLRARPSYQKLMARPE